MISPPLRVITNCPPDPYFYLPHSNVSYILRLKQPPSCVVTHQHTYTKHVLHIKYILHRRFTKQNLINNLNSSRNVGSSQIHRTIIMLSARCPHVDIQREHSSLRCLRGEKAPKKMMTANVLRISVGHRVSRELYRGLITLEDWKALHSLTEEHETPYLS